MCKLADNRKVCVGIVSYNRKDLLISLLNDLSNQSFPIYEIIIVDNCSSDGTPDSLIINEIIDDYVPGQLSDSVWRDIIIHYYRNIENVGGSGGFAKVFELFLSGDSDCIWAMDDDVSPEKDCLSEMMKYLEDQYEGQYYGYCNGDLLIDSSLIQLLTYIHSQQQQHTFLPHVFPFFFLSTIGFSCWSSYKHLCSFSKNHFIKTSK